MGASERTGVQVGSVSLHCECPAWRQCETRQVKGEVVQVEENLQETSRHQGEKKQQCTSIRAEGYELDLGRSSDPESVARVMSQRFRFR